MWDATTETQCEVFQHLWSRCTRPAGHLGQHATHHNPGQVAQLWFWEDE
jgi:hypothetical protein